MHHILPYNVSAGVNATDTDLTGTTDSEFSKRGNHFILSEPYNLLAAYAGGASLIRARFNMPKINAVGRHQLWPINRSASVPSPYNMDDYRDNPLPLPMDEELAVEISNNLGAATEQENVFLFIAPQTWNRNLPQGLQTLTLRVTATPIGVAQAWSALTALTFSDNLRAGWYAVTGMQVQGANALAARLVFARSTMYNNRKLRPGVIVSQAIGDIAQQMWDGGFGEFGRFHSFELPQLEVWANAAGAITMEIRLNVVYLGDGPGQMAVGGNY